MNIKRMLTGIFLGMALALPAGLTSAQEAPEQPEALFVESVMIDVTARKMLADERGTDVENIYNFTVDYTDGIARESVYNVLFYLDEIYSAEYKNVKLPYRFSRDFKGQTDGSHEIRVDLEDGDLTIVGRKVIAVQVSHQ